MDYAQAREKVRAIKGFYVHLAIYLAVIGMLNLLNYLSGGSWWFYWPALAWGTALLIHGISIIFASDILGPHWEKKKIDQMMSKSA